MNNQEIMKDLIKAQLEIKAPKKDCQNNHHKNWYASLDAIYTSCREPLAKNNFILSHSVITEGNSHFLITSLVHVSGERIENRMPLFENSSPNKSQGFAAGLTYARRYAICCLLGLPADEDDDGESLVGEHKEKAISSQQEAQIRQLIGSDTDLLSRILKVHDVSDLKEIKASDFEFLVKNVSAANKSKKIG